MPTTPPASPRAQRTRTELSRAVHGQLASTGVLDVAAATEAAGVSQATFYSHFGTHDDALAAALDIGLTNVISTTENLIQVEILLDRGLADVVSQLVDDLVAAFRVESLVLRSALARLPQSRELRDVYRSHQATSREHLERHLGLAQKAGLVRRTDPAQLATTLVVLTQGLNNPLLLDEAPSAAVLTDLKRAILATLATT
ncbi:MAG: TetR/AcrR family transcriptional regulator [Actinomycetia bacterium]|nr:TetR/AcrR family transcriptional regulator [Actinomycetes bacterium]